MGWALLSVAITLEVAGTTMLKLADGFARPHWFVGALVVYGLCFAVLVQVFRYIPLSIAYAVWGGVGAALIVAIDVSVFGQTVSALKLACIGLIIVGVVGLKLSS